MSTLMRSSTVRSSEYFSSLEEEKVKKKADKRISYGNGSLFII